MDKKTIEDKWAKLIKGTIRKYLPDESYKVFIFGSRAEGTNRKWSDVDVGISGPEKIDFAVFLELKSELQESDIPYKIDVVDFTSTSESFRKVALGKTIPL